MAFADDNEEGPEGLRLRGKRDKPAQESVIRHSTSLKTPQPNGDKSMRRPGKCLILSCFRTIGN
jgi:hypothetical protein